MLPQADPAVRKRTLTSAPKPSQRARKRERALYCNSSAVSSLALLAVHALQIFPACYHASATCSAAKLPLTLSCWLGLLAQLCLPLSSAMGLGLALGFVCSKVWGWGRWGMHLNPCRGDCRKLHPWLWDLRCFCPLSRMQGWGLALPRGPCMELGALVCPLCCA